MVSTLSEDNRSIAERTGTKLLLSCAAWVMLMPANGRAQNIPQQKPETATVILETITVDGKGSDDDRSTIVATRTVSGSKLATDILDTSASVSVITAKEIQQRGAQSVEQVLQYTAGVSTDFYGSDDRFDFFKIRGFDATTYRDGLPLGRPFGGIREEPYAFDRVEVLKGGNSTVFGVSDPGGSVNYVSKRPRNERFGEAYVTGGSFSRKEVGFDFGNNLTPDDTVSYRLTGKFRDGDAEYDYSRDDEKFIMGGLTWRPDDATNLTIVFDHLHKNGVPGSGGHPVGTDFGRSRFFGEPDYNYRGTDRNSVSAMFDHDFGNGFSLRVNGRYSKQSTDFGYAYISSTPSDGSTIAGRSYFGNEASGNNFIGDANVTYETDFANVKSRTMLGLQYNDYKANNATRFGSAPSIDWTNPVYTGAPASVPLFSNVASKQRTTALYLQQDLTIAEKWIASIGLRNDWLDLQQTNLIRNSSTQADFDELTSRFGLTYKVSDAWAVYGSYAQSVAPPAIGVDPERGEQFEVGVKYRPEAFPALFTLALYDLTKNNISITDPITAQPSTIGEIRVRGIDLEAKAEITDHFSLTVAYSYLDPEIVENGGDGTEGNKPQFVSNHLASLWANYTLPSHGKIGNLTLGLGTRYTGAYYFTAANNSGADASVVFDAALSYEFLDKSTLEVNVSNLFDKKYVAYGGFGADFYNPGREITATLRRSW
jgi:iron complex outermembrane receptor protein